MYTNQVLQDPVRTVIYHRGWEDRTMNIQRSIRQPDIDFLLQSKLSGEPSLEKMASQKHRLVMAPTAVTEVDLPATKGEMPDAPVQVPKASEEPCIPVVKVMNYDEGTAGADL